MAHLSLVIDSDPARREHFVGRVRRLFADLPTAATSVAHAGSLSCAWARGPRAPVSIRQNGDSFAILIGYGIDDNGRRVTATDLAERWLERDPTEGVWDGYYVGIVYDAARGLAAAVDPLGMFPLYFAAIGGAEGAIVVSTTPEAFCAHSRFSPGLDRVGLAGILLAHGPLDDRPLLAGMRRLATGHRLRWTASRGIEQRATYRLVGAAPPPGESRAEATERINFELMSAIRRHRPPASASILLSGGLDSRLVAGCLADAGIPARAVIFGQAADHEVIAGSAVARHLGMPLEIVSTESFDGVFPAAARSAARFGHLQAAPGADDFAEGLSSVESADSFHWSGIPLDWVLDPIGSPNRADPHTGKWSFDVLLKYMNRWGVPVRRLGGLLGADGQDLVDTVLDRLRAACLGGPAAPEIQSSLVRWDQRIKGHVATALHRTTFHSWPLMPGTDRRLCEAVFGLPISVYENRRLEIDMLMARCPDLASIPVDKNSFRFVPLTRNLSKPGRVRRLMRSAERRTRQWYWQRVRGFDPRRYERLFNVDHPRWLAVRREVEPLRPRLHSLLDGRAMDQLLPPPQTLTRLRNPVNQGSAIRLLLGLALWTDRPSLA